jgi:2-polyprenyl-6-methoxyphenol hydroxylase-like FAD-dependent oxidoreductase
MGRKAIEFWSGRRRLFYSPCSEQEVYLAFMLPADDTEGTAVPVNHASWIRSFPFLEDVIRRVGDDGRWDLFEYVDLHRWSAGRVAVVGDAANAMSPNTGQGAGTAGMNACRSRSARPRRRRLRKGWRVGRQRERPLTEHTQFVADVWRAHAMAHVHPHANPPLWRALEVADAAPPAGGPSHPHGSGGVCARRGTSFGWR